MVLTVLILVFPHPRALNAQTHRVMNAAETELALKKLLVLGSVLYIAAHPDDENTALLAYLSNERLVRTAYLSITRGDGGQNLIGTEQGALLGVIRTQELLAAREIDGAEQFFTRAIDFGYSKSPEETISIWGRDVILADIVWIIRRFRPDVIITRFPKTGEGGHGHHTASAILAEEAFHAASDPSRFPEQLRSVRPWKPKRLFWNNRRPRLENRGPEERKLLSLDLGSYNPLLGKSYTEVAANSRSMHKSQGFGSAERRGSSLNYLEQLAGEPFEKDLFDGVDLSWRRISGGETAGEILEEALRSYRPDNPQLILPLLIRAHAEISKLSSDDPLIAVKRKELLDVIRACAGLWVEAITSSPSATPGSEVRLTATLVNRSDHPFRLESIGLPYGNPAHQANAELKNNQPVTTQLVVKLPADLDWSQPYWLRNASGKGTFNVNDQSLIGLPENPPALPVTLKVSTSQQSLVFETPAVFRWTDRVKGEQFRPFEIVPPVAINLEEKVQVFPDHQAKSVRVVLKSNTENISGVLRLRTPGGWRV
ncbi:MAG TPA: PIG-L family deacetylase, partial [Pyrinomonadaceae bacterium]|nr:PIG-L family deacetylase [Pyrinomonadaceae bacterium]